MQQIHALDNLLGVSLFGICFAGTLGNLWMIITILRRTGDKVLQSVLLSQLSTTDLVTCLISAPFSAYVLVTNREEVKLTTAQANLLGFLGNLMPVMSLYLILVICIARMVGIVKPLRYKSVITFKRLVIISLIFWTISTVYSALPFYFEKRYVFHRDTASLTFSTSHIFLGVGEQYGKMLTAIPIMIIDIPLFLVVLLLSIILYNLRQKGLQGSYLRREASQTTLCIAVLFAVCYMPSGFLRFFFLLEHIGILPITVYPESTTQQRVFLYTFFLINTYTITVNSFANPILYYTRTCRRRGVQSNKATPSKWDGTTTSIAPNKRHIVALHRLSLSQR
ncbi:hypothetical protein ACHWQZ_G015681 [Mnemiopsis leidyi]